MKKVTLIIGNQFSGKTTKAKELVGDRSSVWIPGYNKKHPFTLNPVSDKTEVIVFEGVTRKNVEDMMCVITAKDITVKSRGSGGLKKIERPDIIVISNDIKRNDLRERTSITVIEM